MKTRGEVIAGISGGKHHEEILAVARPKWRTALLHYFQDFKTPGIYFFLRTVLPGLILLLTVVFCALPNFHPEAVFGLRYHWALDALFHGGYYATITVFFLWLFKEKVSAVAFFLGMIGLSFFLEVVQAWLPGRSLSILDLMSNAIGIFLATLASYRFKIFRSGSK